MKTTTPPAAAARVFFVAAASFLWVMIAAPSASRAQVDPRSQVGELGPLMPWHKDAIHAGFVWKEHAKKPKLLMWMRPSEYSGPDLAERSLIQQIVNETKQALGKGEAPPRRLVDALKESFGRLVYGDFGFSQTLDESVATRLLNVDLPRENTQLVDFGHPDVFRVDRRDPKYAVADLNVHDALLNAAAFDDAGYSKRLYYNLFCAANVQLTDGKIAVFGGHDKGGNNGIFKVNIFDPETEWWEDRTPPQVRQDFARDPTGEKFVHADPHDETKTDPHDPTDMLFQRWYPTAVTLPNGQVLVLSGTDQDSSNAANASRTKVRQTVPEVFDVDTRTHIQLYNAQRHLPMYVRAWVVPTGPGEDDWVVAVLGETVAQDLDNQGNSNYEDANDPNTLIARLRRGYDPWKYDGRTYYFDVQAALADPSHMDNTLTLQDSQHWTLVATAASAHSNGASAEILEIGADGQTESHQVIMFGGEDGRGSSSNSIVERINFADANPSWQLDEPLGENADQNNAVTLPDLRVVIMGGSDGRDVRNRFKYYLYDDGQVMEALESVVPRFDHSTALLTLGATALVMGGNRTDLTPPDGTGASMTQLRNLMVPNAQVYSPPYLFGPDGSPAERPVIEDAPHQINYGEDFEVEVDEGVAIALLVASRTGPITHNWGWGNRMVKFHFEQEDDVLEGKAPLPAQAIGGDYMLFVVDQHGVPSQGKHVRIGHADDHEDDHEDEDRDN